MPSTRAVIVGVLVTAAAGGAGLVITSGGGGGGAPAGAANLWIDSNGGTCTRQSTAGAYSDAGACSSAQTAFAAASCSDRVRYKTGTYASAQQITSGTKSCTTGTMIVFSPEDDTANAYGTASSVVLSGGIDVNNGGACWCEFRDFDTYTDTSVTSSLVAQSGGDIGSNAPGTIANEFGIFRRIDARTAYYEANDFQQIGGSIGAFDSCFIGDVDGIKIWGTSTTNFSQRITIDGVRFHDIHHTCGAQHTDGMQIGGGDGHIIRNNWTYQMPDQAFFGRPYLVTDPPFTNLTVENNMIGDFTSDDVNGTGSNGIYMCKPVDDTGCSNIDVVNNTVGGGSMTVGMGGRNIANNYSVGGFGVSGSNVTNNAYTTINSPGGSNIFQCTPTWASGEGPSTGQLHLASSDTCLRDRGNATTYSATDADGDTRPQGSAPDIGADEYKPPAQGLRFNGTSGAAIYPGYDTSGTAFTYALMVDLNGPDGDGQALISSETAARVSQTNIERLASGGFWAANSIGLYRHTTNQDFVWTTTLKALAADGVELIFVTKPFGGGTCSPSNQSDPSCPKTSVYVQSGGAWTHKSGSPTPLEFQLANGAAIGAGGVTVLGNVENADFLNGDIFWAGIWPSALTQTQENTIASTKTTTGLLATSPGWLVDSRDGLTNDLTGGGRNRTSTTGTSAVTAPSSTVWDHG